MDQYTDGGSPDNGLSIDDFSSPMEFADGGEVLSHTAGYQPTNQETNDMQDAHSMPMLSALAEGGPVGPSARDMLQKFADGGLVGEEQSFEGFDQMRSQQMGKREVMDMQRQLRMLDQARNRAMQALSRPDRQDMDLGPRPMDQMQTLGPQSIGMPTAIPGPMNPQTLTNPTQGPEAPTQGLTVMPQNMPQNMPQGPMLGMKPATLLQSSMQNPLTQTGIMQQQIGVFNPNATVLSQQQMMDQMKSLSALYGGSQQPAPSFGQVSKPSLFPASSPMSAMTVAPQQSQSSLQLGSMVGGLLGKTPRVFAQGGEVDAEGGEVAPQQGGAGAAWDLGISGDWNAPAVNLQPKKLAQVTPGLSASQIAARNRAASQAAIEQAFTKADLPMDSKLFYQWQQKLASGAVTPETLQEQFAPAANQRRVEQAYAAAGIGKDGTFAHPKNAGEMFKLYVNPNLTPTQMAEINQKYAKFGENWDLATADKMRQQILVPVLQAQDFYNRNPEARAAYAERLAKKPNADYVKFARSYLASRGGMGGMGGQPGTGLTWDKSINVGSFRTPVTTTSAQDQSYWVNKLVSGELTPEQFQTEFQASLSTMRPSATGYQYRDQWSNTPLPSGMYYAEGGEVKKSEGSSKEDYSLLESAYRMIPAQNRIFLETALMDPESRSSRPITEKDYTDRERKLLLETIINARKRRTEQLGMNMPEPPPLPEGFKVGQEGKLQMSPAEIKRLKQKQLETRDYFRKGSGSVGYKDYPNEEEIDDASHGPAAAIRNSLGRFTYKTLPDGRIKIMDANYDFLDDLAEYGQRPTADYEAMGPAKKAWTIMKETFANPAGDFPLGPQTLRGRIGSAYIGRKGRPVDITIDPREIMPGYAGYAHGGLVHRAEGSPAIKESQEYLTPAVKSYADALKSPKQ